MGTSEEGVVDAARDLAAALRRAVCRQWREDPFRINRVTSHKSVEWTNAAKQERTLGWEDKRIAWTSSRISERFESTWSRFKTLMAHSTGVWFISPSWILSWSFSPTPSSPGLEFATACAEMTVVLALHTEANAPWPIFVFNWNWDGSVGHSAVSRPDSLIIAVDSIVVWKDVAIRFASLLDFCLSLSYGDSTDYTQFALSILNKSSNDNYFKAFLPASFFSTRLWRQYKQWWSFKGSLRLFEFVFWWIWNDTKMGT